MSAKKGFRATIEELRGFYTAALGIAAQCYEMAGGGSSDTDAHDEHWAAWHLAEVGRHRRVRSTLAKLSEYDQTILQLAFEPRQWAPLVRVFAGQARGHLVGLLPLTPSAQEAHRKAKARAKRGEHIDVGLPSQIHDHFEARATEDAARKDITAALDEAEALLEVTLGLYDIARVARIDTERKEREAKISALRNRKAA